MSRAIKYLLMMLVATGQQAWADIDVHFEASVTRIVNQQAIDFKLVGHAKREFLFFDVYDVASYVSEPQAITGSSIQQKSIALVAGQYPKLLTLIYHRNIGKEKIRDVLMKGFKKNLSERKWSVLKGELEIFLAHLDQDIHKNDRLELIWLPENKLSIRFNQSQHIQPQSELFLSSLWRIWFGEHAVVRREDLFSS